MYVNHVAKKNQLKTADKGISLGDIYTLTLLCYQCVKPIYVTLRFCYKVWFWFVVV